MTFVEWHELPSKETNRIITVKDSWEISAISEGYPGSWLIQVTNLAKEVRAFNLLGASLSLNKDSAHIVQFSGPAVTVLASQQQCEFRIITSVNSSSAGGSSDARNWMEGWLFKDFEEFEAEEPALNLEYIAKEGVTEWNLTAKLLSVRLPFYAVPTDSDAKGEPRVGSAK